MAFFPRFPSSEFGPLFRLLDDYASHSATREGQPSLGSRSTSLRAFTPKFDIREVNDGFELQGELPGIAQKDINIEFTDANTLTISGRTERTYEEGSKPTAAIEAAPEQASPSPKATVEDEAESSTAQSTTDNQITPAASETQEVQKQDAEKHRYWISERSVGQFSRSFSFPGRVDHENVKASLKDGILNVVVPKAQAPATRKITIE
ncbi:MAG: hypothetical protein M1820_005024 [Bogoriella megaspora]|nr:MAG: hypothetical protein M1820_005024 [Bogoriella megaspora]